MADELIVVHDGRAVSFDGDLEDYARWLAEGGPVRVINSGASSPAAVPVASPAIPVQSAEQRKQRRREEAAERNRLGPLRSAVQRHEQKLEKLSAARSALDKELAAPELYQPDARVKLQQALERQKELEQQSAEAEAAWLEASTQLEAAQEAVSGS